MYQKKNAPRGGAYLDVVTSEYSSLRPGTHRMPCPYCNKGPKDTAYAVTVEADGSWVTFCHRCHATECSGQRTETLGRLQIRRPLPQPDKPGFLPWMRDLWDKCEPIGGIAADYLHARHCAIPPADGDLRWTPQLLHHPSGYVGAALVGRITHAVTNEPLGLHRTWITATKKADVTPAKMMAGRPLAGGVIRLWPDEAVTYGLGIAEGIETALSLAWAFKPVWCAMDAGHLAKFPALAGIESLTIGTDNDSGKAGIEAAEACAARWHAAGKEAHIRMPEDANDLNDVVREVLA